MLMHMFSSGTHGPKAVHASVCREAVLLLVVLLKLHLTDLGHLLLLLFFQRLHYHLVDEQIGG